MGTENEAVRIGIFEWRKGGYSEVIGSLVGG
jgi:hypothetical protein